MPTALDSLSGGSKAIVYSGRNLEVGVQAGGQSPSSYNLVVRLDAAAELGEESWMRSVDDRGGGG